MKASETIHLPKVWIETEDDEILVENAEVEVSYTVTREVERSEHFGQIETRTVYYYDIHSAILAKNDEDISDSYQEEIIEELSK